MGWEPPSESEFNDWTTPDSWLELSHHRNDYTSKKWLLDRLKGGLAIGVARTSCHKTGHKTPFDIVPPAYWQRWDDVGPSHFWETGDAEFVDTDSSGYSNVKFNRYFDVRFDPQSFNDNQRFILAEQDEGAVAQPASAPPQPADQPVVKPKGGAPRKSWWDDLWIEVLREIRSGKLTADTFKSAKFLEFHLTEIVERQSEGRFSPGESTCQPMAQKILKYLKEIGGK